LTTVDSQIKGIENRLKYSKNDLNTSDKTIRDYDRWMTDLQKELDLIGPNIAEIERRMTNRDAKIQEIKGKMNTVEDEYFKSFCKKIGVANIRQYEDRELVLQQERDKKLAEFEQQIDRINTNLDFEKSKDTSKNVLRWERTVQDDEDSLESLKQAEKRHRDDIDKDKEKIETLKLEKQNKKRMVDEMEEETAKARRDVASLAKDIATINHQTSSFENKIDSKRNERLNILRQCKMDDIQIPMMGNASLEDILQEQESSEQSASLISMMQSISDIQVDYRTLPRNLKDIDEPDQVKKTGDGLNKELQQKLDTIEKIQTPNLKAMQKLDAVTEKIQSTNEEFENAKRKAKKAKAAFEKVKNERISRFNKCLNHISEAIDGIYKALSRNDAAQAFLNPDNPEESYLDGINYNCVAPGKRFQPMSNLSGGEKTIAALALLFAIHSYLPSPFFVLDEIDAALDNTNIGKVAKYIREQHNLQTVVISLKEEFYGHADILIGITPQPADCLVSRTYLYDLTNFEAND
jgi:structural maintenance of chromosome 1